MSVMSDYSNLFEHYSTYTEKCNNYKYSIEPIEDNWKFICIDDINIDDYIYVRYDPYSLKHLYEHTPECGKVIEIKIEQDVIYNKKYKNIIICNHLGIEMSIHKYWLGDYSNGYDLSVYTVSKK